MRLLDLFCGAGGASVGYAQAGFKVTGVDICPQPHYPFTFIQADAMSIDMSGFDVIHASPPCQAYSMSKNNGCHKDAPKLIEDVRERLLMSKAKAYVIENVLGAPLMMPFMLCGSAFGLGASGLDLPRHRYFECSHLLFPPPCTHHRGQTMGVYGNGTNSWHRHLIGRCLTVKEMREAMEIDWMVRRELSQAIPPAYTKWIGQQLLPRISK